MIKDFRNKYIELCEKHKSNVNKFISDYCVKCPVHAEKNLNKDCKFYKEKEPSIEFYKKNLICLFGDVCCYLIRGDNEFQKK